MDLLGKKNSQSQRTTAFDASHNNVNCGDTIKVHDGPHKNRSGTIKHILKSVLWLHSSSHLKDSGIFVVRSRSCVLSGSKAKAATSFGYGGSMSPGATPAGPSPSHGGAARSVGSGPRQKDSVIGKTITITRGANKGYQGTVLDSSETHYHVELLAKLKKIMVEKEKTVLCGDKHGSLNADGQRPVHAGMTFNHSMSQSTPFMTGSTPSHAGGATPMHSTGSETPSHGGGHTPTHGGSTPGGSTPAGYDPWSTSSTPGQHARGLPATSPYRQQDSGRSEYSGTSTWGMDDSSIPSQSPLSTGGTPLQGAPAAHKKQTTGATIDKADWPVDAVVLFRNGPNSNSLGVLQSMIRKDGTFTVVKMAKGQVSEEPCENSHYSDLVLAEPKPGSRFRVLAGKNTGQEFTVKRVYNNDVFCNESQALTKLKDLVWIMPE